MQKKIAALVTIILMVVLILPATALADDPSDYQYNGVTYDGSEYSQLKAFLDTISASAAHDTNGKELSASYSDVDPATWTDVTWAVVPGNGTTEHVTDIDWTHNQIQSNLNGDIDLSDFTYLTSFKLYSTQVDSLKVNNDTALATLWCYQTHYDGTDGDPTNTGITNIDVRTCTALQDLQVQQNSLTALDVSKNTVLTTLYCGDNAITELDLSNNTSLSSMSCDGNKLTYLDTSAAGANLTSLDCSDNLLPSLTIDKNTALKGLNCSGNKLTSLDISKNTALVDCRCEGNQISGNLDCTHLKNLQILHCGVSGSGGNALTALTVTGCTSLKDITCQKNNISQLVGLGDCSALDGLRCDDNALTGLDVSGNPLTTLTCSGNKLITLDLSKNTALSQLECSNCGLSSLDLTNNTALNNLDISDNNFSSIDLGAFSFNFLDCTGNPMTSVDAKIQYGEGSDFTVKLKASGDGYAGLYDDGAALYAMAEPKTVAPFIKWTDDSGKQVSTAEKYDLTSGNNYDLTANFETIKNYKVDAVSSNTAYGSVSGGGSYPATTSVTLTATANPGYYFTGWYSGNNLVSTDAAYKLTASEDITLTAQFKPYLEIKAVSSDTASGSVSGGVSCKEGDTVTLTATEKTGYYFAGWYDGDTLLSADAAFSFTASKSVTLTARFASNINVVAVSCDPAYGSASGGGSFKPGTPVTFSATPNTGYCFAGWYNGDTLVSSDATYKFTVSQSVTLTARFRAYANVIAVSGNAEYGSVSGGGTFAPGASVTLTAVPNTGYYFAGWYDGATMVSASATYTFSASADVTLTAQFDKIGIPETITATSSAFNKITVKWSPVTGVKGYYVYRAASADGTYKKIATSKKTTYVNSGVTTGTTYYYKVAAYTKSYKGSFSAVASAAAQFGQVTKVTVTSSNPTKAVIKWKAVTGAKKYQVLRSDTKDGTYTAVKTTSSKTITDTGLIPGNTYYYKVVAYKGAANGPDSDIVSVTPKAVQATKVKASRAGASKIKITWKAAAGSTGYEVYVSTDGSSYSLLTDVKKTSCADLSAPKTAAGYYFKVVAYTTVNGMKYKGSESATYHFTK